MELALADLVVVTTGALAMTGATAERAAILYEFVFLGSCKGAGKVRAMEAANLLLKLFFFRWRRPRSSRGPTFFYA